MYGKIMRTSKTVIRHKAMDYLARREYSYHELRQKLYQFTGVNTLDNELIGGVLDALLEEGLLSDLRFAEAHLRYYSHRGYGPLYLQQKLQLKKVDREIINKVLNTMDGNWYLLAEKQRTKRFGKKLPGDQISKLKQMRYLQNRGFLSEDIEACFTLIISDESKIQPIGAKDFPV